MEDKKVKNFTKGIEEIAKLHPADRKKVFQMVMRLQPVCHYFESLAKLNPSCLCPHSSICAYSDHTTLTVPGKTKIIIVFVRDTYGRYNTDPVQKHVMCKCMIPVHVI